MEHTYSLKQFGKVIGNRSTPCKNGIARVSFLRSVARRIGVTTRTNNIWPIGADFLGAGVSNCVCSCAFSWSEEGPCYSEASPSSVLSGAWDQSGSVDRRYWLGPQLQT